MAIAVACIAACVASVRAHPELGRVLLAGTIMALSGAFDDHRKTGLAPRLVWPAIAALLLLPGYAGASTFLSWLLTFLLVLLTYRAFYVLARLDGLAAGSAVIIGFFFGLHAVTAHRSAMIPLAFAVSGAALGQLPFGYRLRTRGAPIRSATGEAGARFLGLTMAALVLLGNWSESSAKNLMVPALMMAVPLGGVVVTLTSLGRWSFARRALTPTPPAVNLGIRRQELVLLLFLANLCLCTSAILYRGAPLFDALLIVGQVVIVLGVATFVLVIILRRQPGAAST